MTDLDTQQLMDWIGREESALDTITAWPAEALARTLDLDAIPAVPDTLPPAWHWLHFLSAVRASGLGYDGHARLGGFLPPIPLPRRMWAGGRLRFDQLLRIGERATRVSRIADVAFKTGRSGPLAFVLVHHEITGDQGAHIVEEHDIVYRAASAGEATPAAAQPAPAAPQWSRALQPDPVLLFRYSALTFNGHRIHYDRDFCSREGYPGLVVHGPLIATLLLGLLQRQRPDSRVRAFAFKAVSPLFDIDPFSLEGRVDAEQATLWALNHRGALAMSASAELERTA